jgi:hypothetical protein
MSHQPTACLKGEFREQIKAWTFVFLKNLLLHISQQYRSKASTNQKHRNLSVSNSTWSAKRKASSSKVRTNAHSSKTNNSRWPYNWMALEKLKYHLLSVHRRSGSRSSPCKRSSTTLARTLSQDCSQSSRQRAQSRLLWNSWQPDFQAVLERWSKVRRATNLLLTR